MRLDLLKVVFYTAVNSSFVWTDIYIVNYILPTYKNIPSRAGGIYPSEHIVKRDETITPQLTFSITIRIDRRIGSSKGGYPVTGNNVFAGNSLIKEKIRSI